MINSIKKQITKLHEFAATKPKVALPIFAAAGLTGLLLISFLITLVIHDDSKTNIPTSVAQIKITKDGFIPASLIVEKGTKIIWTNDDKKTHQVQANPHPTGDSLPSLRSEILNKGQTYEYTAGNTGSFGYHDHLNPTTNGTIEVRD